MKIFSLVSISMLFLGSMSFGQNILDEDNAIQAGITGAGAPPVSRSVEGNVVCPELSTTSTDGSVAFTQQKMGAVGDGDTENAIPASSPGAGEKVR